MIIKISAMRHLAARPSESLIRKVDHFDDQNASAYSIANSPGLMGMSLSASFDAERSRPRHFDRQNALLRSAFILMIKMRSAAKPFDDQKRRRSRWRLLIIKMQRSDQENSTLNPAPVRGSVFLGVRN